LKGLLSLVVLLAVGASFVGAIVSLFSGQILAAIGLFFLSAILNGIARGMGA